MEYTQFEELEELLPIWYEYYESNKHNRSKLNDITMLLQNIIKYAGVRTYNIRHYTHNEINWVNKQARKIIKEKKKFRRHFWRLKNKDTDFARNIKKDSCYKIICRRRTTTKYLFSTW